MSKVDPFGNIISDKVQNPYEMGLNKGGRPPMFETGQALLNKIIEYFDYVISEEKVLTITGLCLFAGFASRQSFYDYEKQSKFAYIVKRARLVIENHYEEQLFDKYSTGAIFALKNMNWTDKTEIYSENINTNIDQVFKIGGKTITFN